MKLKRVLSRIVIASGLVAACSTLSLAHAADTAAKPDAAKGEQLYLNGELSRGVLACVTCHGAAGNSVIEMYPNIAAQPFEYVVKQLHDFRPGAENTPPLRRAANGTPAVMTSIVTGMTEQEMRDVAFYVSQQKVDWELAGRATNEETFERGQQIWRGGLPDRNVAACAACHSPNGAGLPGKYPRLAGQHVPYLLEQLKLFRSGDRNNEAAMHELVDRMNDGDLSAVADYAAGLR